MGKESSHLRRRFQPAGAVAGRAGVASQALPSPLPWRIRQPSAHLAGMSLWQLPYLSPFQTGVVTHLPAPVGSWLPTPWPGTCPWQSGSFSMSCWLEPPGFPGCLGPDPDTSGSSCSLYSCLTNCWSWDYSLAHLPLSPAPYMSSTTPGRFIAATQTHQGYQKLRAGRNLRIHQTPTSCAPRRKLIPWERQ